MSEHQHQSPNRPKRSWVRCVVPATAAALSLAGGGIVMASQGTPASAAPREESTSFRLAAAPLPAAGKSWIQGVITDQANHALDNVNVEVWPADPAATAPVASNLTYAGVPADARHQHGVFRVEVPTDQPYVVILSSNGGAEDGDSYRMKAVGNGRPIVARSARTSTKAAAGRVVDLGTFQLARQGRVPATTTARLATKKVDAGKRARLNITVRSKYVAAPTGKVVVRVGGRKATDRLRATDQGKTSVLLPKLKKQGKHRITVTFPATSTIARSASKPVRLTVK